MAVVVAQHPDDLGLAALAQAADVGEQAPGVGAEMAEAPVVEDVAQQDQALEAPLLEHGQQVARPRRRQAEMQVRHDQRVDVAAQPDDSAWERGVDRIGCRHWPTPAAARPDCRSGQ